MRPYNSETDYHLIVESVARIGGEKSLATIARDLQAAGIRWPRNFNEDRSPEALAIDRDVCKAWGV